MSKSVSRVGPAPRVARGAADLPAAFTALTSLMPQAILSRAWGTKNSSRVSDSSTDSPVSTIIFAVVSAGISSIEIRLVRAVKAAGRSAAPRATRGAGPTLLTLFDILTVQESYRRYLLRCSQEHPSLPGSSAFCEARFQLENNYWNQPPDQLGGVRSTLYNFLVPFSEPEIAEVFCSDSTFDLRDIQLGKVVCLAVPQRFSVQRRYVATLLKTLAYQIILERFDRRGDHPDWTNRNVILVEQDEWKRHAVRADCETDVVREAQGAVYAATQSQNAVWLKVGGREKAL